jgi:Mn2+/Fe2+ NRAMP family transporter
VGAAISIVGQNVSQNIIILRRIVGAIVMGMICAGRSSLSESDRRTNDSENSPKSEQKSNKSAENGRNSI